MYVRTTLPRKPVEDIQQDLYAVPGAVQDGGHQLVSDLPDISALSDRVKLRAVLHTITHREGGATPYADGPVKRHWGPEPVARARAILRLCAADRHLDKKKGAPTVTPPTSV